MMKVALILLIVANLFSWIAFTTTSWGYIDSNIVNFRGDGLWMRCGESVGCSRSDGTRLDWYAAFQAFGIFGFVGINLAMLLVVLTMFVGSCKGNAEANMGAVIMCFAGAVCWLIAVIIFAAEWPDWVGNVPDKFGFSFALAIIALIISVVAGILLVVGGKGGGGTSPA
ncbi:hypothetical protein V1264_000854 [Littorina saxatilis]